MHLKFSVAKRLLFTANVCDICTLWCWCFNGKDTLLQCVSNGVTSLMHWAILCNIVIMCTCIYFGVVCVDIICIITIRKTFICNLFAQRHIEGILPKGPYLPCVSMAGRALLAGYHQHVHWKWEVLVSIYTPSKLAYYCNMNIHDNIL